jgi:hypothetical protein
MRHIMALPKSPPLLLALEDSDSCTPLSSRSPAPRRGFCCSSCVPLGARYSNVVENRLTDSHSMHVSKNLFSCTKYCTSRRWMSQKLAIQQCPAKGRSFETSDEKPFARPVHRQETSQYGPVRPAFKLRPAQSMRILSSLKGKSRAQELNLARACNHYTKMTKGPRRNKNVRLSSGSPLGPPTQTQILHDGSSNHVYQ